MFFYRRINLLVLLHCIFPRQLISIFVIALQIEKNVFEYIWDNWILGPNSIDIWKVFDRPENSRTTIICEGWNWRRTKEIGTTKPNLLKIISQCQHQELLTRLGMRRKDCEETPTFKKPLKTPTFCDLDSRLLRLKNSYLGGHLSVETYWDAIENCCRTVPQVYSRFNSLSLILNSDWIINSNSFWSVVPIFAYDLLSFDLLSWIY